jgi:hypothetical protein
MLASEPDAARLGASEPRLDALPNKAEVDTCGSCNSGKQQAAGASLLWDPCPLIAQPRLTGRRLDKLGRTRDFAKRSIASTKSR